MIRKYNGTKAAPSARDWNRIADGMNGLGDRGGLGEISRSGRQAVTVVNNDTCDIVSFTVWALEELPTESQRRFRAPLFSLRRPGPGDVSLAVVQQHLRHGETGLAVVSGVTPVRVYRATVGDAAAEIRPDGRLVTAPEGELNLLAPVTPEAAETGICIAILGAGGGRNDLRGPFHCRLENRENDRPVVVVRDTSLGSHYTLAGLVQLGHRTHWVNAVELEPSMGMVILTVRADDETDLLTSDISLTLTPPKYIESDRVWWTILAIVTGTDYRESSQDGDGEQETVTRTVWKVAPQRLPGNIEILGRWA